MIRTVEREPSAPMTYLALTTWPVSNMTLIPSGAVSKLDTRSGRTTSIPKVFNMSRRISSVSDCEMRSAYGNWVRSLRVPKSAFTSGFWPTLTLIY